MRWQPSNVLSGPAKETATGYRLTLEPSADRVEMVGPQVAKDAEFSVSFVVASLSPAPGVPLILWQLHDGADAGGLNPIIALECRDNTASLVWRHHVAAPVVKASVITAVQPVGSICAQWRIDGRTALDGAGYLRVRRNGVLLLDYTGPLGYAQPGIAADYIKRGLYSWAPRAAIVSAEVSP